MYELRPYQESAVQELLDSKAKYLAYDMGLGKTLIMIDFLRRTGQKALVVAPLLVAQRTWPQELQKWAPELTYAVIHGKPADRSMKLAQDVDVKIINFDGLTWLMTQPLEHLEGRVLIVDEASALKSPSTKKFKVLRRLRPMFVDHGIYMLSGTPMPSGYKDLWAPYSLLDGGVALTHSYSQYMNRMYKRSGPPRWEEVLNTKHIPWVQKQIAPLTSVLRAQDHVDMPEHIFINVPVVLPPKCLKAYNAFKREKVLNLEDGILAPESAAIHGGKLRQITQGALYNEDRSYTMMHTAKLEALHQLVMEANGSPILCPIYFSFERKMINDWFGEDFPTIHGGMSTKDKEDILDRWDDGKIPLLLCQPGSLSHGVNMQTGGSIIVWYGRPWSLELFSQLNGRLIRPGQKNIVRVYFIHAVGTADERVAAILDDRAATQEAFKDAILSDYV